MHENPLLPNRRLQELYLAMQSLRSQSRREPALRGLEALFAASLLQLEPGDFADLPAGLTAPARLAADRSGTHTARALPVRGRFPLAVGVAQGLQMTGNGRLAMLYTEAEATEPDWQAALIHAGTIRVPLIVFCMDRTATQRKARQPRPQQARPPQARSQQAGNAERFGSAAVLKLAASVHLPVLSVDGSDAVAVYRVTQESVLRARTLGGTAVLWCSFPSDIDPGNEPMDPLRHMRGYLAARKLLPPRRIG